MLNINNTKFRLPDNKYFHDVIPKEMIMLHFTAGHNVSAAYQTWMSQNIAIGTPYILDQDGTVYETFDPKLWAYHIGCTGPKAQNHKHDKRSVPIEVINYGPLKLVGDTLMSWPGNYTQKFCKVTETDRYVEATYRGFDYFEAFPAVQKAALVELVQKISTDFNIPIILPPVEKRTVYDMDFFDNWKGVASHQNFRPDKFDIGPAWDWSLLG